MNALLERKIFFILNVYGPTNHKEKDEVWYQISSFILSLNDEFVILGGDFNATRRLQPDEHCL